MMKITEMKERHVAQVAQLEALCFADPWSETSIASELRNDLAFWLVAEEDGAVVGYIGSQTVFPESDMMNVAVHPDHRRKGIGAILVEALITHLRNMDCENLTLEVRASNESAILLYEKLGFAQIGLRKNYYRNPKEDALIMRKML